MAVRGLAALTNRDGEMSTAVRRFSVLVNSDVRVLMVARGTCHPLKQCVHSSEEAWALANSVLRAVKTLGALAKSDGQGDHRWQWQVLTVVRGFSMLTINDEGHLVALGDGNGDGNGSQVDGAGALTGLAGRSRERGRYWEVQVTRHPHPWERGTCTLVYPWEQVLKGTGTDLGFF